VTVQEDLATGVDALVVLAPERTGEPPARLAAAVAADYLDGAGMVVVETPLAGPVPTGAGPEDGLDLLWVHRDLDAHPPAPAPGLARAAIGPDPSLAGALPAEFAASLAVGARYAGLADLLPDAGALQDRVRALVSAGTVRWAGLARDADAAFVLWQRLVDPFLDVEVVDLVDICGAAAGAGEALLGHVAAAERARWVRGNVAVSPTAPQGWQVLRGVTGRGWTPGGGRWRFAVSGERVLPWRAAPPDWRRAALAATGGAAG